MNPVRRFACLLVLIVDVGFLAWGAMAALAPDRLLGPDAAPIVAAGYQGFTGRAWSELVSTAPSTAGFMTVLFRVYGAYNVAFGVMASAIVLTAFRRGESWAWWATLVGHTITLGGAMTYDRTVNAIGPFEVSEYVGLVFVFVALALTAPFLAARRTVREPHGVTIL